MRLSKLLGYAIVGYATKLRYNYLCYLVTLLSYAIVIYDIVSYAA